MNRRVAEKESELRLLRLTGIRTRERLEKVVMILIFMTIIVMMIIIKLLKSGL